MKNRIVFLLINNVENEITQFKKLEIGVINIVISSVLTKCLQREKMRLVKGFSWKCKHTWS